MVYIYFIKIKKNLELLKKKIFQIINLKNVLVNIQVFNL